MSAPGSILFERLAIIGVGLIGGSLAAALKQAGAVRHVVGVDQSVQHLQDALALGLIDSASSSIAQAIQDADVIVVCVPVAATRTVLTQIAAEAKPEAIITDVGSVKASVCQVAQEVLGERLAQFVPAHPIAGSNLHGPQAARADLFAQRTVVITALEHSAPQAVDLIERMWQTCQTHVRRMSPDAHDAAYAAVSHLPHLLAFAYMDAIAHRDDAQSLLALAGTGFRDFTRIAGSSPQMWRDIFLANQHALVHELQLFEQSLGKLRLALQDQDSQALEQAIAQVSRMRANWSLN